jgi:aerobic-type carbon monoxide dehydrogenase small subunit (CoxS/CutS family)
MISLRVNREHHAVSADPEKPLLWLLRDELKLKGTTYGCGVGVCGICTVLIDGAPNHACVVPLRKAAGREALTVERLAQRYPALVQAWIAAQVPQCGYCHGGQLLVAAALVPQGFEGFRGYTPGAFAWRLFVPSLAAMTAAFIATLRAAR